MAFKQYTSCFLYPLGGKPYNEKDRIAFIATRFLIALVAGLVFAAIELVLGPIGAIVGGVAGLVFGITQMLQTAANEWLNHRLICCLNKGNPQCAVGIVSYDPSRSDLGDFDNDQFFDVILMPHPTTNVGGSVVAANRYKSDGKVADDFRANVDKHPANNILTDKFQGQDFLTPRSDLQTDLGYESPDSHERWGLHCEAEGDFWVRVRNLAPALAILLTVALTLIVAGTAAGAAAGAALGCAIGSFFLGPIGCAIGAIIGGLIGAAVGGGAAAAASYFGAIRPILQAIFDANPGDVEDANVGDKELGPIRMGDHVAVLGEHVYDGYHKGWHEFHPLMAVVKIGRSSPVGPEFYLQWNPDFSGTPPSPPPGETTTLTQDDMRQGLESQNFRTRCENLKRTWCTFLNDAFSSATRQTQQKLEERWTIHPAVDGCRPARPDPGPSGPH